MHLVKAENGTDDAGRKVLGRHANANNKSTADAFAEQDG